MTRVNAKALSNVEFESINVSTADFEDGKDEETTLQPGDIGEVFEMEVGETGQLSSYRYLRLGDSLDSGNQDSAQGKLFADLQDASGTTVDEQRDTPALQLASQDTIGDVPLISEIDTFAALGGVQTSGTYTFASGIDLGSVQNVRLESALKALTVNQLDTIASRTALISTWESITGNDDASSDVRLFVRATDDDPSGSPTWTPWERLDVGEYEARGFQFQLRLTSSDQAFNVLVEEASVSADQVA